MLIKRLSLALSICMCLLSLAAQAEDFCTRWGSNDHQPVAIIPQEFVTNRSALSRQLGLITQMIDQRALIHCQSQKGKCNGKDCVASTSCVYQKELDAETLFRADQTRPAFSEICCSEIPKNTPVRCKLDPVSPQAETAALSSVMSQVTRVNQLVQNNQPCEPGPVTQASKPTDTKNAYSGVLGRAAAVVCAAGSAAVDVCKDLVETTDLTDPLSWSWRKWLAHYFGYMSAHLADNLEVPSTYAESVGLEVVHDKDLNVLIHEIEQNLKENGEFTLESQKTYVRKKLEEAKKGISQAQLTKISGGGSLPRTLAGMTKRTHNRNVTLLDLERPENKDLKKIFQNLSQVGNFTARANPKNLEKVLKDCEEQITIEGKVKQDLLEYATEAVRKTNKPFDPNDISPFYFLYGEPGNFKTSGLTRLSKCSGIPLCIIDHEQISNRDPSLSVSQFIHSRIVACTQNEFRLPGGGYDRNGKIVLDDFDQVLQNELKKRDADTSPFGNLKDVSSSATFNVTSVAAPKPDKKSVEEERTRVFQEVKALVDPNYEFPDPETGYPLDKRGFIVYVTGNTVPADFRTDPIIRPVLSRMRKNELEYASESYRRKEAQKEFDAIRAELEKAHPGVKFNFESCAQKVKEIGEFDIAKLKSKEKQGRLGVRGLGYLLGRFKVFMAAQAEIKKGNMDCSTFDVIAEGTKFDDYKNPINAGLLELAFTDEVSIAKDQYERSLENHRSEEVKTSIFKLFDEALDATQDLAIRKRAYEKAMATADFALKRHTISDQEFNTRFKEKFAHLKSQSPALYTDLKTIASQMLNKSETRVKNNRVVLVDKQTAAADLSAISTLAEIFEAPICEQMHPELLFKNKKLGWMKFQNLDAVDGDSFSPVKLNYADMSRGYSNQIPLTFTWNRDKHYYSASSPGNDGDLFLYSALTKEIKKFSASELEEVPSQYPAWLEQCVSAWKNSRNQGHGVVLLKSEHIDRDISKIHKLINSRVTQDTPDEISRDLRSLTVFVIPKGGAPEAPLSAIHAGLGSFISPLRVNRATVEGRRLLTEQLTSEYLKTASAELHRAIEFTPQEKAQIKAITEFDQEIFHREDGNLSDKPLRTALQAIFRTVENRLQNRIHDDEEDHIDFLNEIHRENERIYQHYFEQRAEKSRAKTATKSSAEQKSHDL